ncbi:MAG: hypothetical protein MZV70_15745 [Desulfobacterales bacterium]|nr:hypothetical protein [Desulfobacterales bacterium]
MGEFAGRPVRHAVERPEAARQHRARVPARARAAHPRRADRGARRDLRPVHRRVHPPAARGGPGRAVLDPHHERGRVPVRPHPAAASRPHHRRGRARRSARPVRLPEPDRRVPPSGRAPGESNLRSTTMVGGTIIGTYRLEELLGDGGLGAVYRAVDSASGREAAFRVFAREVSATRCSPIGCAPWRRRSRSCSTRTSRRSSNW